MPTLFAIVVSLGVLLAATGALLLAGYLYLRRSLPSATGTVTVSGIDEPLEVIRDANGVAHIFARTNADAYFGLGFVHAQDRLWQMEYQRRFAAGRLAEIFGKGAIRADQAMRTIGLRRAAEQALTHLPDFAVAVIDRYVAGINHAIRLQQGRRRPLEYRLLKASIEPWTAADVVSCGKLMAWNLAGTYTGDLLRADMIAKVGPARTAELMSFVDGGRAIDQLEDECTAAALGATPFDAHLGGSEGLGSNQWVVDGTRSVTQKPVLANDPHLPPGLPGLWHLAHLSSPDLDVIGATVPGIPAVVSGRNRSIGWGIASLDVDVQDLFSEPIDGARQHDEVIKVRRGADVHVTIRTTAHGPIMSEFLGKRPDGAPTPPLALRWTALDEEDSTIAAFIRVNAARDWTEFTEAFRPCVAPVLMFTYADVKGNIGSRIAGRVPIRSGCDGSVPITVASGGRWTGWVPFEEMPSSYNPSTHAIVSANTREVDAAYPHFLGHQHIEQHRRDRIWSLLQADARLSLDDHAAIQLDTVSVQARKRLPLLLSYILPKRDLEHVAFDLLLSWDHDMRPESAAAAVFAAWWRELPKALVEPELGPDLFKAYDLWPSYADRVLGQCLESTSDTRIDAAIQRSFTNAVDYLEAKLGPDPVRWRWDRLHRVVFAHKPFHGRQWLRPFVSRTLRTGGDWSSVNVGGTWAYDKPFEARYVAGYRQILDLSTSDGGLFIQAIGQSGHVLSKHYVDMAARWRQGGYMPMQMSRHAIVSETHSILRLKRDAGSSEEVR